jgi:hypothetical protein
LNWRLTNGGEKRNTNGGEAPYLLNTAPSGGLQTLSVKRMRWACHHLLFSIEKNYLCFSFVTHPAAAKNTNHGVAAYQRRQGYN